MASRGPELVEGVALEVFEGLLDLRELHVKLPELAALAAGQEKGQGQQLPPDVC